MALAAGFWIPLDADAEVFEALEEHLVEEDAKERSAQMLADLKTRMGRT